MLSALSRGYSSWNGELDVYGEAIDKPGLPEVGPGIDPDRPHRHGVTVTPRNPTAASTTTTALTPTTSSSSPHHHHPYTNPYYHHPYYPSSPPSGAAKDDGCLDLPKTFLTRKGALLLFTAPDTPPEQDGHRHSHGGTTTGTASRRRRGIGVGGGGAVPRKRKQQDLIDLSLKLGTLERLSLSVLQYGDQGFDRENSSVSDKENRWFLKFLHQLKPPDPVMEEEEGRAGGGDPLTDYRAQPGADLNFYLQDLKHRASSRCYGRESSLSSRARSQELRDILQQLEEAWPSGHGQPLSQAPTSSLTDGAAEEFLYPPRSPSLCSESSRTFSGRAKVLSSHKLTASLKSLNYLGRPPSTDPGEQARCVTSPDPTPSGPHLSRVRRSKSQYWSGTVDSSITEQRKRPGSSQYGARRSSSMERQLVNTPEWTSSQQEGVIAGGAEERGPQAISVQVSSPMGFVVESSERPTMGSVVEEEMEGDRTSMSSSLQQEDDILLPSDGEEGEAERRSWMEAQAEAGLAKPLQPQYSGVLQDSDMLPESEEDKLHKSEQGSGSRPGSRAGSRASVRSRDVYRPSSVMSSRAASRTGMVPEEEEDEEVDQEGLDQLMAQATEGGDQSQFSVDEFLLDHATRQLENQEKYAASYTGSVDRPEPDPETLISLQGGVAAASSSSVKSGSDVQNEAVPRVAATPEPRIGTPVRGTPEPRVAGTPEPSMVAGTPEPRVAGTPEPRSATPASVLDARTTSRVSTPESKAPSELKTGAGDDIHSVAGLETKPAEDAPTPALAGDDAVSIVVVTEGEEGGDGSGVDAMAMGMSEAGLRATPSPLPPSRSASPALSAAGDVGGAVGASVPEPVKVPVPSPLAELKAEAEKAATDVLPAKAEAKSALHAPSHKPATSSRHKSPAKAGGKGEKKPPAGKTFVKAMDITSVKTDEKDADGAAAPAAKPKEKKPKESYRPPPPPPRVKTPSEKQNLLIPDHMKEALERSNTLAQYELENELMQMHKAMEESLGLPATRMNEDGEGLTEEELEQAQQALKARMEEAQKKMQEALLPEAQRSKTPSPTRKPSPDGKARKGKKVRVEDPKAAEEKAKKEAAKEQRRLERQKRLEEAKALQDLISQKEKARKEKEEEAARRAREVEEQVEIMKAEEDAILQAEEDAREQMAALRKSQREEREARRKADLEKKKQDALARREKEKKMMEDARRKEQEMLDRIADAEMKRAIREEEERKRDEEERLAQERYEEELREAQQQAEEEERRLQELEKQAEEEAFQRIIQEREEAERQREELELQAKKMAEEEERQRQQMLAEEKRLEEERHLREAEEKKRREEERQRLKELQRLEQAAREKMRAEIEQRREWALKRREVNLDRRKNLDGLRQSQGMTEPWVFSYFVHWSRETYGRPMGEPLDHKKKKKPVPKKKKT